MGNVKIERLRNAVHVVYNNSKINLPLEIRSLINNEWNENVNSKNNFINGEVFSIEKIYHINEETIIEVGSTDYAHYLCTIYKKIPKEFACRVFNACSLVETSDRKAVIGQMAQNTSTPGQIGCSGGGIDRNDLCGNRFDITYSISRELYEELGIDVNDSNTVTSFLPSYIKTCGENNFISIIYKTSLAISELEFRQQYNNYIKKLISRNVIPEFSDLEFIDMDIYSLNKFIENDTRPQVDYLTDLLKIELGVK